MKKDYAQLTKIGTSTKNNFYLIFFLLFALLYFMEFAINPHKIIRKAKVKSLLTSQGSLHYLLSNYNCLYGKTEILL